MNYKNIIFKFNFLALLLIIFSSFLLSVPAFAAADETGKPSTQTEINNNSQKLPNPLGITDVNALISRVINFVLSLVGSVSLIMFVYGGLTWMTSAGSSEKIKKGRDIIVWSVIGLAIVFSSYILVKFVVTSLVS
ncbi:MAG: pilin [Patescibacteria group bacterium]